MKNEMDLFEICQKLSLTETELNTAFNIIKNNMINLGFNVESKDETIWKENIVLNLKSGEFFFFLIYHQNKIVGFIELSFSKDIPFVSEIQFSDSIKQTRAILYVIKFLLDFKKLKTADYVEFSILKTNKMSKTTFSHLGGKIISETDKKYKYSISKSSVEKYLSKFTF